MNVTTVLKRLFIVAAVSLVASLAAVAPARATTQHPRTCPVGYLCLQHPYAIAELVPEGESREFPGGRLVAEVTNLTSVGYCVLGNPSFAIWPGASIRTTQYVFAVGPNDICLAGLQSDSGATR